MSTQETAVAIRLQDLSPEYAEIMVLGKVLQASGYFTDVRDQAQAVTKILYGRELGFSPIVSMSGIHIIEGKPALSSNLMAAMIKRSGKYDYRIKAWDSTQCVIMFRQKVGDAWEEVGESGFTIEDAKTAQVKFVGSRGPSGWTKFPKAMLFARALSQGLRTYCPDVASAPIYNPEEMGATVDEEGAVTELPKSARAVAVTTEDIEIVAHDRVGRPVVSKAYPAGSGPDEAGGSGSAKRSSSAPATLPPLETLVKTATEIGGPGKLAGGDEGQPLVKGQPSPTAADVVNTAFIEKGQAANLHKLFRDALKPAHRKEAETLLHDWLKSQGIVDGEGKGTALAIYKTAFFDVRECAVTYAASL